MGLTDMTDKKTGDELKCPYFNAANDKPSQTQHEKIIPSATALPPTSDSKKVGSGLLRLFVLAAIAFVVAFIFFQHKPHPAAATTTTITAPDSGKNTTIVTPTTATKAEDASAPQTT